MGSTPPAGDSVRERRAFKRRGRIVFTFLGVLVLLSLAPLTAVAWKLIDGNREALTTSAQEFQMLLASSIANEVDTHVAGLESELVRVAQALGGSLRRSGSGREEELRRTLADVVDERMLYVRYTYFRGQSTQFIAEGSLPDDLEQDLADGLRDAAEVLTETALTRPEQAIASRPILLPTIPPRAVVVVSAPVVSRGRFRGVISALIDFQSVWDGVMARTDGRHVIFALDDAGQIFVSSNLVAAKPGHDASDSLLGSRYLSDGKLASETLPFTQVVDGREVRQLGSYYKTRQDWGIFVQAGLDDVYIPIQDMKQSALSWAAVVFGIAVLLAIFFAGTLSTPIKRLAAASRAFASGDFDVRVEVRSRNEIGELAYTFNTLADEIEDQIRRLKRAAEENKELFLGTVRALAQAIDAKDPYTRGHSVRVNRYSVIISQQMDLGDELINDIHVASLMHDVGKIGVNDAILQKPGKLTPEEFEVMKSHTVKGASIMAPIRQMERIIPGLRNHHEKWAGGGYPDGLKGEEIPLMARVITVADAFDAMTTHRPYQRAMTFQQAVDRLNDLKGTVFDERVMEAFNRAYQQGLIAPGEEHDPSIEPAPVTAPMEAKSA